MTKTFPIRTAKEKANGCFYHLHGLAVKDFGVLKKESNGIKGLGFSALSLLAR